jgi:hypothetical protein
VQQEYGASLEDGLEDSPAVFFIVQTHAENFARGEKLLTPFERKTDSSGIKTLAQVVH